nr:sigma-70 family RNA polymerase sigma factor [uncultured Pseudodesulfovibrio sp.]
MSSTLIEIENNFGNISYDELFKRHSKLIFRLIYNFINAKNIRLHNSEVDDVFQEIALKIYKNNYLSKYNKEKSSFITWLNIICKTTTIDYYRKKIRWTESVLTEAHSTTNESSIDTAMFSLPAGVLTARQTEVITLLFKEGMVACEVATALGITTRTVRSIKFQALNRLRGYYGATTALHEISVSENPKRKVS